MVHTSTTLVLPSWSSCVVGVTVGGLIHTLRYSIVWLPPCTPVSKAHCVRSLNKVLEVRYSVQHCFSEAAVVQIGETKSKYARSFDEETEILDL
jgi:hypothetical protein